jgi:hypothetical protein
MFQNNRNSLVCPSTPKSRKPSIMFDGMNVVLPFKVQMSSDSVSTGNVDELDRAVHFSLKPRSNFTRIESDGVTTKVAIDSFPPPPFGCKPRHEMARSSSNSSKLPSQVRLSSFTRAKQHTSFNARCA